VVEEFFVRAPPKRVVHDRRAGQRRILEPGAIKRNVLRNAIDHDVVAARFALDHFVDLDELGDDIPPTGLLIHPLDKGRRETVLLTKKDSDFLHFKFFVMSSGVACRAVALCEGWETSLDISELST